MNEELCILCVHCTLPTHIIYFLKRAIIVCLAFTTAAAAAAAGTLRHKKYFFYFFFQLKFDFRVLVVLLHAHGDEAYS